MDPIDEIEGGSRRSVQESAQRRSAFLREVAQKAQRKPIQEAVLDEPPTAHQKDSLDFSSEFSSQDMGLGHQSEAGTFAPADEIQDEDESLDDEPSSGDEEEDEGSAADGEEREDDEHPGASETEEVYGKDRDQPFAPPVEQQLGYSWGPPMGSSSESSSVGRSKTGPGDRDETAVSPTAPPSPPPIAGSEVPAEPWAPLLDTTPRVRPVGRLLQQLPPREPPTPAVSKTASVLLESPPGTPGYQECLRLLARFGQGALRLCIKQRVQVKIYTEAQFRSDPELRGLGLEGDLVPVDGAYLVGSRTCLIDQRCLLQRPAYFHPGLYYFAHALDHAQGGETFSSRKATAVRACYESFASGAAEVDFVDELAAADPTRYFARAVSIYLCRDDCSEPLWTREDLRDFDRSMYDYLNYLFERFEQ